MASANYFRDGGHVETKWGKFGEAGQAAGEGDSEGAAGPRRGTVHGGSLRLLCFWVRFFRLTPRPPTPFFLRDIFGRLGVCQGFGELFRFQEASKMVQEDARRPPRLPRIAQDVPR